MKINEEYKMREVAISGIDFTYNKENSYEKDGHIYCKKCHQRLDGEAINNGRFKLIPLNPCECKKKDQTNIKYMKKK